MLDEYDKGSKPIRSGDKALIFYLLPNRWEFRAIALPAELIAFPSWFAASFSVDMDRTESKLFDSKLQGIFEALAAEFTERYPPVDLPVVTLEAAGEYKQANSYREALAGANLLFNLYPTPYMFYGFENSSAFLRALYGNKPLPQLVDEFTTQIKKEGLVQEDSTLVA
jgi:hypothetical protein